MDIPLFCDSEYRLYMVFIWFFYLPSQFTCTTNLELVFYEHKTLILNFSGYSVRQESTHRSVCSLKGRTMVASLKHKGHSLIHLFIQCPFSWSLTGWYKYKYWSPLSRSPESSKGRWIYDEIIIIECDLHNGRGRPRAWSTKNFLWEQMDFF